MDPVVFYLHLHWGLVSMVPVVFYPDTNYCQIGGFLWMLLYPISFSSLGSESTRSQSCIGGLWLCFWSVWSHSVPSLVVWSLCVYLFLFVGFVICLHHNLFDCYLVALQGGSWIECRVSYRFGVVILLSCLSLIDFGLHPLRVGPPGGIDPKIDPRWCGVPFGEPWAPALKTPCRRRA